MLNIPRVAREVSSFASDVKWFYNIAKNYYKVIPKSEPEVELSEKFRCVPRYEPEPWSREYESWDPGWTIVRTSNDPFYTKPARVL